MNSNPASWLFAQLVLEKNFCTLSLEGSDKKFLASEVYEYSDALVKDDAVTTYYYLEYGEIEQSSAFLVSKIKSNCDLAKLKDIPAETFTLSPLDVYADAKKEGEPVCSFPAGSNLFNVVDSYFNSEGGVLSLNGTSCGGLVTGYVKERPYYLYLYKLPE